MLDPIRLAKRRKLREEWKALTLQQRSESWNRALDTLDGMVAKEFEHLETHHKVTAKYIASKRSWQGQFICKYCGKVFIFNEWGRYKTQAYNRIDEHLYRAHSIKRQYGTLALDKFVDKYTDPIIYGKKEYCNHCGKEQYVVQAYKHNIPVVVCRECNTIIRNGMK
jgi:hypothetical protein